jgi:hypothetical protein
MDFLLLSPLNKLIAFSYTGSKFDLFFIIFFVLILLFFPSAHFICYLYFVYKKNDIQILNIYICF